jgi:hypothetical protein
MRSTKWLVTDSNGKVERVASLLKFCREKDLQYYDCLECADNPAATHKGYHIERVVPVASEDLNPFLLPDMFEPAEDTVEQLRRDLDELKKRVHELEHPVLKIRTAR